MTDRVAGGGRAAGEVPASQDEEGAEGAAGGPAVGGTTLGGMTLGGPAATVAAWRTAGERGDAAAAAACLAPDAVLISPLTSRFRFEGREGIGDLLAAAFTVIHGIGYHTEVADLRGQGTAALFYRATVRGIEVEEAQLLRFGDGGLIRELTLFGRPLPALTAVMSGIGPELARRDGRRGFAAFLRANTAPLHAMVRTGDRRVVPLADPARRRKR